MFAKDILKKFENIDPSDIKKMTNSVEQLIKDKYNIDIKTERDRDFIVRPIVAAMLTSELYMLARDGMSSLDMVSSSVVLSDEEKYDMLKKYAISMGLTPISKDWKSLYLEIKEFVINNWHNIKTPVVNKAMQLTRSSRIYIADTSSDEMIRNKIPLIQFPDYMSNNFSRKDNIRNVLRTAFSRRDVENYKKSLIGGFVSLPNTIDVYMASPIKKEEIRVIKNDLGFYVTDRRFWIDFKHNSKHVEVDRSGNDFAYGITKRECHLFIEDGDDEEVITATYYDMDEPPSIKELINQSDILYKGMFPAIMTITILSRRKDIEPDQELKEKIDSYIKSKNGNMSLISIRDINDILSDLYGRDAICSSMVDIKLCLTTGVWKTFQATLPLSKGDIKKDNSFPFAQITENTVFVQLGDIRVVRD